jgi:hypothetical protein
MVQYKNCFAKKRGKNCLDKNLIPILDVNSAILTCVILTEKIEEKVYASQENVVYVERTPH